VTSQVEFVLYTYAQTHACSECELQMDGDVTKNTSHAISVQFSLNIIKIFILLPPTGHSHSM